MAVGIVRYTAPEGFSCRGQATIVKTEAEDLDFDKKGSGERRGSWKSSQQRELKYVRSIFSFIN